MVLKKKVLKKMKKKKKTRVTTPSSQKKNILMLLKRWVWLLLNITIYVKTESATITSLMIKCLTLRVILLSTYSIPMLVFAPSSVRVVSSLKNSAKLSKLKDSRSLIPKKESLLPSS